MPVPFARFRYRNSSSRRVQVRAQVDGTDAQGGPATVPIPSGGTQVVESGAPFDFLATTDFTPIGDVTAIRLFVSRMGSPQVPPDPIVTATATEPPDEADGETVDQNTPGANSTIRFLRVIPPQKPRPPKKKNYRAT